jgi:hypothetical protein
LGITNRLHVAWTAGHWDETSIRVHTPGDVAKPAAEIYNLGSERGEERSRGRWMWRKGFVYAQGKVFDVGKGRGMRVMAADPVGGDAFIHRNVSLEGQH